MNLNDDPVVTSANSATGMQNTSVPVSFANSAATEAENPMMSFANYTTAASNNFATESSIVAPTLTTAAVSYANHAALEETVRQLQVQLQQTQARLNESQAIASAKTFSPFMPTVNPNSVFTQSTLPSPLINFSESASLPSLPPSHCEVSSAVLYPVTLPTCQPFYDNAVNAIKAAPSMNFATITTPAIQPSFQPFVGMENYPSNAAGEATAYNLHRPQVQSSSPNFPNLFHHPRYTPPHKIYDLPDFNGTPEDWPIFYNAYLQSTATYGYGNLENNQRLQKCLKGEAKEVVKCLLIHPNNVNAVIEQLKFRFGRPELLIHSQLNKIREIGSISESTIDKLVPYATKVKNFVIFMQSVDGQHHMANPMLLEELVSKLPMSHKMDWARYAILIKPYPTIVHFSAWLDEVAKLVCTVIEFDSRRRVILHTNENNNAVKLTNNEVKLKCGFCQGSHKITSCEKFQRLSVQNRWVEVKRNHLCFSCLKSGHSLHNCRQKPKCSSQGCDRKHHSLLHDVTPIKTNEKAILSCTKSDTQERCILFRVVPVTLFGPRGKINTYALMDEGSSITMMDESLVRELGLSGEKRNVSLQWLNDKTEQAPASIVNLQISGEGLKKRYQLNNVHAMPNLKLPVQSVNVKNLCGKAAAFCEKVKSFSDAVPRLLIGLDHCHLGVPAETVAIGIQGPYAANTELGWVIYGPTSGNLQRKTCLFTNIARDELFQNMVQEYFTTENFGVKAAPPMMSAEDIRAQKILQETTVRIDGRFQVGLLWKDDRIAQPDNFDMAKNRLVGIEKKMNKNETFAAVYKKIIADYVEKGYARKLSQVEVSVKDVKIWYLPHFGVVNINKPNKKRLVFDAAAAIDGVSLNSNLLKGPQDYLPTPTILFNFRVGAIAVTGDIKEMFHQVLVQPSDRVLQRFLWRDGDSSRPPDVYEMKVMTFGAACSPCAAQYVKVTNALESRDVYPRAVESIVKHHYVDDYVDSFPSVRKTISTSVRVREIHGQAGFELRGFISNSADVTKALKNDVDVFCSSCKSFDKSSFSYEKVLGTVWQSQEDVLRFQLKFNRVDQAVMSGGRRPSKREVLSAVMSVFDPLGIIACFMISAKLLMREIWRRNITWDEPVPDDIEQLWKEWIATIAGMERVSIPRHYFCGNVPKQLQLHVFVDASENAFSPVAFWRFCDTEGQLYTAFICGKTKCAPMRPMTIPRLELQAAVLDTRLMQYILQEHSLKVSDCILWSDSVTVLRWIRSEHYRYKPFVAHRIAEVLSTTTPADWRWVPSQENVANVATRWNPKINPDSTLRWLKGPQFLLMDVESWPKNISIPILSNDDCEVRAKFALIVNHNPLVDFTRFSSFNRLRRTMAWVIRFINHCRKICCEGSEFGLTAVEIGVADTFICRLVQNESYLEEIKALEASQSVSKESELYKLTPYLDEDAVLRVGGRIDAAGWLPYNIKHPVILPCNHDFTKLAVMHFHTTMKHQNLEATICEIRRKYWIPKLRTVMRTVISNCQHCKLEKTKPVTPLMASLPKDRLTPYIRPFTYTGVDYFGPLVVTVGRRHEKRWVALFTCLTMRAIHLEVANDLSTDSFILVFRNFVNRRGLPLRIRSDNGKNFVGANQEAKRFTDVFDCERIQNEMANKGVEWIFNCPINPSEGGIWKRMVQCVNRVLRQTLKEVAPREHTLLSFVIEAENIVNSRPLTHLPVNVDDEEPLTPNHFLLGTANTAQTVPVDDIAEVYVSRKQWRIARHLRDAFWKRWIGEYLPTLTRREKWCERTKPIEPGDVVFICDSGIPRRQWCRGIIENVYVGRDDQIRSADVKTTHGILRRPVSKLAVLDVEGGES